MNAKNRSASRVGLVMCSALAVVAAGCTTSHVHTRTVYVPTPAPVVVTPPSPPSPVVEVMPAPAPVVVVQSPAPTPVVVSQPAPAPVVVIQTESDFYEPLGTYGRWEVVAGYGRCWIPGRVEAGWRPYSDGYWQRTDAGWYWMSNEPWGWATYHYGRWDWHVRYGWYWVPQTQWAPAWVCWREGGGYVGWAPLRPSVSIGVNIHVGDYEPAHASRAYVFVEHRRMLEPVRPKTVIVNNTTIINQTVNITKIKVQNKTVINEGPRLDVVERETGRKVHSVAAREARDQEETIVAARERNIPTAKGRNGHSAARNESQSAQAHTPAPPKTLVAEATPVITKPVETAPQVVTPVRQAPAVRANVSKVEREDDRQAEVPAKARGSKQVVETKGSSEPSLQPTAPNRPIARTPERPAEVVKQAPAPVVAVPVREEVQKRPANDKATPKAVQAAGRNSRNEVSKESRIENHQPARVESSKPVVAEKRVAPEVNQPARRAQVAPRERPRTEERAGANKPKDENKGQKKKAEQVAVTNSTGDASRNAR